MVFKQVQMWREHVFSHGKFFQCNASVRRTETPFSTWISIRCSFFFLPSRYLRFFFYSLAIFGEKEHWICVRWFYSKDLIGFYYIFFFHFLLNANAELEKSSFQLGYFASFFRWYSSASSDFSGFYCSAALVLCDMYAQCALCLAFLPFIFHSVTATGKYA